MIQNNLAPKRYSHNFSKLNWKNIAWRHLLKSRKYSNCKVLLHIIARHTNIITDKGFNLFDECAARCPHLFPQEEESTCFSWKGSKIYTSGRIANSQRRLNEVNRSGAIAKIRIWVESDTVKHFNCLHILVIGIHYTD